MNFRFITMHGINSVKTRSVSSANIDAVTLTPYLRASMNFCPYSPHLPTDLDEIRPKIPAHNAVDYLSVCFVRVAQGRPYFLLDINVITFS